MKYSNEMLFTETESLDEWTHNWIALRGRHPFFICSEITFRTVKIIELFKEIVPKLGKIDVIIHSPGGELEASFKVPYVFKTYCPHYIAIIPRFAKSGATLFSLGATEIVMGQWAELGPLDPQIPSPSSTSTTDRHYFSVPESALESFHALRFAQKEVTEYLDTFVQSLKMRGISPRHAVQEAKELVEATIGRIYSNVSPFELGNSGRALEVMERYCAKILNASYENNKDSISQKLVWDYPDHGFFIDAEEARQIGLNVSIANEETQVLLDQFFDQLSQTENYRCIGTLLPEEDAEIEEEDTQPKNGNTQPKNEKTQPIEKEPEHEERKNE